MPADRIEISGGIGSGKTTLARALAAARAEARLVEEAVRDVPFFSRFYREPAVYGFEKNVSFVLSHADRVRASADPDGTAPLVCDYALYQDLAYTDIVCPQSDVVAVEAVHGRMIARVGHPRVLVHLTCAPRTQLERIARRGRPEEAGVSLAYLTDLCAAHDRRLAWFAASSPDTCRLTLDTDSLDLDAHPGHLQEEARRIWTAYDAAQPRPQATADPAAEPLAR